MGNLFTQSVNLLVIMHITKCLRLTEFNVYTDFMTTDKKVCFSYQKTVKTPRSPKAPGVLAGRGTHTHTDTHTVSMINTLYIAVHLQF